MSEFFAKLGIGVDSSQVRTADKDLAAFDKRASQVGKTVGLIGAGIAVGFVGIAKSVISATVEAEAASAILAATLASTSGAAGKSLEYLTDRASELQKKTTFDDEAIVNSMSVLAKFTNITGDTFDRATDAAINLAASMKTDLSTSARLVGRALQDPVAGSTALTRAGVILSDAQKDLIKQFSDAGDKASAQGVILKHLEVISGGAAKAAREKLGGALTAVKNAFGELFEATNAEESEQLRLSLEGIAATLSDPSVAAGARDIASGILAIADAGLKILELPSVLATLRDIAGVKLFGAETVGTVSAFQIEIDSLNEKLAFLNERKRQLDGRWFAENAIAENNARIEEASSRVAFLTGEQKKLLEASNKTATATKAQADTHAIVKKTIDSQTESTAALTKADDAQRKTIAGLIAGMEERIALFGVEGEEAQAAIKIQLGAYGQLTNAEKARILALSKAIDAQEAAKKAADDLAKSTGEYKKSVDDLIAQSLPEQDRQLIQVRESMLRLNIALEQFPERAEQINAAIAKLADDEARILAGSEKQLSTYGEQAAKNIQDAFAEFLFNPFEEGLDGMLSSFIGIIKTMVAQAAAADIAAAIGLPGAGAGGNLSGIFGAVFGGKSGAAGMPGGGSLGAGIGSAASWLGGSSLLSGTSLGGGLSSYGASAAGVGNLAFGAAGLLGGLGGQMLFGGPNSGIGGSLGAVLGAPFGPLGSVAGGLLGGALGGIGGDGKNKTFYAGVSAGQNAGFDARTNRTLTAASGLQLSAVQRRAGEAGIAQSSALLDQLAGIDAVLTGALGRLGATVDLSGQSLAGGGLKEGKTGTFFGAASDMGFDPSSMADAPVEFIRAWIDGVSATLDPALAKSLADITGNTVDELLLGVAQAVDRVEIPRQLREAASARNRADAALAESSLTATDTLGRQVDQVLRLADAYDGSTASHEALIGALQTQQVMADALALALVQASDQVSKTLGALRDSIEESGLSEEALYNRRKAQIDNLNLALSQETDPSKIIDSVNRIADLTNKQWASLSDEQQTALRAQFIGFLDDVDTLAQSRIDAGLAQIDTGNNAVFDAVSAAFTSAGADMSRAAEMSAQAAQANLDASRAISDASRGINNAAQTFNAASANMMAAASALAAARSSGSEVAF